MLWMGERMKDEKDYAGLVSRMSKMGTAVRGILPAQGRIQ